MTDKEPSWRRYREFLSRRPDDDVDDEVRHHLEMRRQEALRSGLDPERANAAARERFGDVDGIVAELYAIDRSREKHRNRIDWLADVGQDVRFALRSLRRAPAFAAAAVTTLAVAIAANTTIFSFVNALLLEPLPFRQPEALVRIEANVIGSTGELLALRERTTSFSGLGSYRPRGITLNDDRDATRIDGFSVSANLLSVLGVAPALGVGFAEDAGRRGANNGLLISHTLWMERYGGDRDIVGRQVLVDGAPYTILGVMPARFQFPSTTARFWVPTVVDPANIPATWSVGGARFVARLKPGVNIERAAAELGTVLPGMRRLNPIWDPGDEYGRVASAVGLQQSLVAAERPALRLLFACVVVVLLVACVNLANLMLARVTAREREFTVRSALGGGRGRLVRQLLTESIALSTIGGVLGLALAIAGVRWTATLLPPTMTRTANVRLDATVLVFTAGLTIVTGLAFGLLPALRAASAGGRASAGQFSRGSTSGPRHHRIASFLVAAEVALAVLLAIVAGLLTRSFDELRSLSPGFRVDHVLSAKVSPPAASYRDAQRTSDLYSAVLSQMSARPGVINVGLVDRLPIAGPVYGMGLRVQGQFEDATRMLPSADHSQRVTPGYFAAMGIPILSGRVFSDDDGPNTMPVAIVSQSLARRFWPNGDAIGGRIGYPFPSPWITIVGIVPDVKLDSLRDTASFAVYTPFAQRGTAANAEMSIVVRSTVDDAVIARQLREILSSIDRTVPLTAVRAMNDVVAQSVAAPRFTAIVVGGFALTALLLGATGIFGVMSYTVSQRTREMGVRVALGATPVDIIRLVVGRAALLAVTGAVAGCAMALIATRGLGALLYGVSATDPLTFGAAVLLFVGVAVAASVGPARRATRVDPVQALRDS